MAHTMAGWTRSLLAQHVLLASQDVDEVRARIAELLNDHELEPRGSTLAARLNGVQAGALGLWMLEYGEAVTVEETRPGGDFVLVQLPLSGSVGIECEEGRFTVSPGSGLVMPSNVSHRLDWEAGASQIILKVPLARLLLEYEGLTGSRPGGPLRFNRKIELGATDGEQWSALMRYFCEQLAHPSPLGWLKARMAEEALMRHLLCAQSVSLHEHYLGDEGSQAPRRLQRARSFMEANLQEEVSVGDIARHSGASVRSLSRMCRMQYGVSPMQLLRDMRLDKVRAELAAASADASVSEVALRWGLAHLGRFAASYRQRFGEAPHETLAAGRQRARSVPHITGAASE
ncbi:AraC family transcriptional regulator [Pusillimonas noertemannii]|uniref:AraC-like DNA-binding protein n=1 Tax=Pusillimonas noertemannii TaxID=305977 RepID=A0A2U1CPV4_9BURK|nr:AraC family transcriptional regulator [Pusillimonas noertemannii]NYT67257.1 AraC family transcriptional regulator [Pusillimonas noertemannii]PVY67930.1 AraC-like DNA-binding protein [Pusillimonas noertemannii]